MYCLLWYSNATVVESKVRQYSKVYYVSSNHTDPAFLLNCPAKGSDVPVGVSVFSLSDYDDYCKMPRNFLKIRYEVPGATSPSQKVRLQIRSRQVDFFLQAENGEKKSFAVCTRGLLFTESSYVVRLIEWIELLSILGVDKISLYYYYLADEVLETLRHYDAKGVVELIPWSMSGHHPRSDINSSLPSHVNSTTCRLKLPRFSAMQTLTWQNQLGLQMRHDRITYNDCFYRNIHMYKYVAVLDVDEVRHIVSKEKLVLISFLPDNDAPPVEKLEGHDGRVGRALAKLHLLCVSELLLHGRLLAKV